ncbi:hypothetical protein [Roseovarius sp.]|uniref:hypothetical protein n=1 Tax=Roseovarius sp. TaxID=1486281 RepID=UPI00356617B1
MDSDDRIKAPALRSCPARAELAEFAHRAPHLDFALAQRRASTDALLRAASAEPRSRAFRDPGSVPPTQERSR